MEPRIRKGLFFLFIFVSSWLLIKDVLAITYIGSCGYLTEIGETYVLTSDVYSSGTCFTIKNDSITLDCNGHSIIGDGSGAGVFDPVAYYSHLTIKNCNITNFDEGIYLYESHYGNIYNNEISLCDHAIAINGHNYQITQNYLHNNTEYGLVGGYLPYQRFCEFEISNSEIIDNTASNNGKSGFRIAGDNMLLKDNLAFGNGEDGLEIVVWTDGFCEGYKSSVLNTLINNSAYRNGEGGIDGSDNATLKENLASFNGLDGIACGENSTLINNTANSNKYYGFSAGINSLILNNTAFNNTYGFGISGNCTYSKNNASFNTYGFYSSTYFYAYSVIKNNRINNNTYGLYLNGPKSITVFNNYIINNEYGVYSLEKNLFYNNYFSNHFNAAGGSNDWNISKTPGTNIIGGPYLGGNYWSDYEGLDLDGDGIGDTNLPYNSSDGITSGGDYLPLVFYTPLPQIPISSCQKITSSGKYYLTKDIFSSGTCITIEAENVTLNCSNHKIVGSGASNSVGIVSNGYNNIQIENCTIENFERGIYFANSVNHTIKNNVIRNMSLDGILLSYVSSSNILNNEIFRTRMSGINVYSSSNMVIDGNRVDSTTCDAPGQDTSWCAGIHIYSEYGGNNNIISNNYVSNSLRGIRVRGKVTPIRNQKILGNTLTNIYGDAALQVDTLDADLNETIIAGNKISDSGYGILLGRGDGGIVYDTRIYDNILQNNTLGILITAGKVKNSLIYNNYLDNVNNAYEETPELACADGTVEAANKQYFPGATYDVPHWPATMVACDGIGVDCGFDNGTCAPGWHQCNWTEYDPYMNESGELPGGDGRWVLTASINAYSTGPPRDECVGDYIGLGVSSCRWASCYGSCNNACGEGEPYIDDKFIDFSHGEFESNTYARGSMCCRDTGGEVIKTNSWNTTKKLALNKEGLVGYWRLDEGTGTIAFDSSENDNDGTLMNGPTWVDGKYGKALSFDGVDDYVNVPHSSALNITGNITVAFWLYPRGWTSNWQGIVAKRVPLGSFAEFGFNARSDRFQWYFGTGTFFEILGTTAPPPADQWTLVVGIRRGNVMELYYNDSLIASKTFSSSPVSTTANITIGTSTAAGEYFNGSIDEVKIYSRGLTPEEIKEEYEKGTSGRNIIGGIYLGGNYWSDYNGSDADGDGIGDVPYSIPGGSSKDYLPLVSPAPIITIYSPVNGSSYYKSYIPLNFSIDKEVVWIGYSLNNTENVTITGPINLTGIADGWNDIIVYAKDAGGNMGSSDLVYFFYCLGDINGDGKVNIRDVAMVASKFGCNCGMECYDSIADMNDDCKINIRDVSLVASQFGKYC